MRSSASELKILKHFDERKRAHEKFWILRCKCQKRVFSAKKLLITRHLAKIIATNKQNRWFVNFEICFVSWLCKLIL